VLLDLRWAIQAESIAGLSLQALVDEVGSFERPALGQLAPFDVDLLCEDHITDLLAAAADVRAPAHHELVADDADGEVVDSVAMILAAHNLGCHVAGRTRRILRVLISQDLCNAHICDAHIARLLHDDVLRLDIAMNHPLIVHVLQAQHHARQHKLRLILTESALDPDMKSQVASRQQVANQVEVLTVLKRVVDVDQEWVLQLFQ